MEECPAIRIEETPQPERALVEDRMDLHHWQESELAAVLRHQMQAPLRVGLETLPRQLAAELRVLCEAQGLLIRSVYDLLDHPLPPWNCCGSSKTSPSARHSPPAGHCQGLWPWSSTT
jgi:hypothetical protein